MLSRCFIRKNKIKRKSVIVTQRWRKKERERELEREREKHRGERKATIRTVIRECKLTLPPTELLLTS